MEFDEYLAGKRIDSAAFRRQEPVRWEAYRHTFGQVHPESFTTQKKFMLNDLRRRYLLETPPAPVQAPAAVVAAPPVAPAGGAGAPPAGAEAGAVPPPRPARPVMRPVVKQPEPPPAPTADDVPVRKPAPRPVIRKREE